ncbi:MAG: hypothetical protein PQJ49_11205 [Sphaerochaetaceae bacterium]|nr:hypothetical protein [Sphaerochaetaceae bacterium]
MKKKDKRREKKHVCRICKKFGVTEFHHIFYGQFRNKSEQLDLVIEVCPSCHREIHNNPKEFNWIKETTQQQFEKLNSHESWMQIFNRSWL